MLKILVAVDENNAIGKDNHLLCHLPDDLKRFKQLSTGHTVVMGRKTYDSIGKALPNRKNIVITRQVNLTIPGCEVVHSLKEALSHASNMEEIFIIGGAEIFNQAMALCDTIFLTRIHHQFEADTYFPEIDLTIWEEIKKEYHPKDEKHPFAFSFIHLKRKVGDRDASKKNET